MRFIIIYNFHFRIYPLLYLRPTPGTQNGYASVHVSICGNNDVTTDIYIIQLDSRLGLNVKVGKMDDYYSHQIGPCIQFVYLKLKC